VLKKTHKGAGREGEGTDVRLTNASHHINQRRGVVNGLIHGVGNAALVAFR